MAINFPDSPTLNQEFTVGDRVWFWNGTVWKAKETAILETGKYIVSETAPANPEEGDGWFDSVNTREFIYYDGYWVETSAAAVGLPSNNYATEDYVDNQVAGLVDSAPATLDTLNELAAALNDDANFASTVTSSLSNKSDIGHTHTISDIIDYNNLGYSDVDGGNASAWYSWLDLRIDNSNASEVILDGSYVDGGNAGSF
jgi:hypothetical protein